MDKIPKLRRKPRPPAIETRVERTSTDTSESNFSNNPTAAASTVSLSESSRPPTSHTSSPRGGTPKPPEGDHKSLPRRKSPFRNLRLRRSSAKRARENSPADSPLSPPPSLPPISGQDGVKVRRNGDSSRQSPAEDKHTTPLTEHGPGGDPGPVMPSFLDLSAKDMNDKFVDLNWEEMIHVNQGNPTHHNHDWNWGLFAQTDAQEKGRMDRYMNIKPWNHNRVRLNVPEGELDYVNASTITIGSPSDSNRPPLRYIAMQGPTDPSVPYVWRMIAEQGESSTVIIQLTNNVESGNHKCIQYFPGGGADVEWALNDANVWGDGWKATLRYHSLDRLWHGAIEKRKLTLHVEGQEQPQVIWHFWYRRWADFGVPGEDDYGSFFELMRLSREHSSPSGPRIIHCSAGVGRTGTFIALEHLIRELDVGALCDPVPDEVLGEQGRGTGQNKPDLVFDTVKGLRQQRRGMVQSDAQYRFLYHVLRKLWTDRYGTNSEDEDKMEGGVGLGTVERLAKQTESPEPFYDAVEDDDDDEGGAKVRPDAPTPSS